MDVSQLLRALGLQQAYQSYQQNIGQPFANLAGPFGRGLLGLEKPEYGEEQAYRTGQAVGNMPAVGAPVGAFKAAAQVPGLLVDATQMAKQVGPELAGLLGLTAFHGSPHRFSKFDASKIGTGEGAQAYGHGLYFAESPGVAKGYQINLTSGTATLDGKPRPLLNMIERDAVDYATQYGGQKQALEVLNNKISQNSKFDDVEYLTKVRDRLGASKYEKNPGAFYTVDIPDEMIGKMLDWDKPLHEQPKIVQDFLSTVSFNPPNKDQLIGDWLKPRMSEGMAPYWSEDMRKAGIPGIRYLDQGSRGTGAGTRNFVVFPGEEEAIKMLSVE